MYELKLDGWRTVAGVQDGNTQLMTCKGADYTKAFPEVVEGLSTLQGGPHILDGELCVLDDLGRSDFDRLQDRAKRRHWYAGCDPVVFCAFDLLALDGKPLIGLPIQARKLALKTLLSPAPASVMYVGDFDAEQGAVLFHQAEAPKLEGLVAKRLGSIYVPGERSLDWIKCKVPDASKAKRQP
jgi:bifunctional non-homologous end joining protein LigD